MSQKNKPPDLLGGLFFCFIHILSNPAKKNHFKVLETLRFQRSNERRQIFGFVAATNNNGKCR